MKSGQLFWGFFLLCIGALFLSVRYDFIVSDFGFVWDVWPLIFILWGAMVIFKHEIIRPILSAVFGLFLGLIVFGIFYNIFSTSEWTPDDFDSSHTVFNQEYNAEVKRAEFEFGSGAGVFLIKGTTDNLFDAETFGSLADYDFTADVTDSLAFLNLEYEKNKGEFFNGKIRNKVSMSFNPNPIWDFNLNFGAAKAKFDLSDLKIRNLDLNAGAANIWLKLGNKNELTNIDVEMGAAGLTIEIPQNSGCRLYGDMVLMTKNLKGFSKNEDGYYETENYSASANKIEIKIDGGVSSLRIDRY